MLGVPIGLLAGYRGGWVDNVLMRLMDAIASVPALVFALAIVAATETGLKYALPAISVAFVPGVARIVRGEALAVREETFIEASHSIGTPNRRILWKRVLPNVSSVIIVQATFIMAAAILVEAALSIIGAGVKPGQAAWGSMISEAFVHKEQSFLNMFWPGLAISLTSLSYNLVGDGLRDVLGIDTGRGAGVRGRLGLTTVVGPGRRAARRSGRAAAGPAPNSSRAAELEAAIARELGDELPGGDGAGGAAAPSWSATVGREAWVATPGAPPLLAVEGLTVEFALGGTAARVVEDVSFAVGAGEVVGLVGESGSGKTVTSLAIMRLIPSPPGRIVAGTVRLRRPRPHSACRSGRCGRVRGGEIAMIFQDPIRRSTRRSPSATRSARRCGCTRACRAGPPSAGRSRCWTASASPRAARRIHQYPHQFSGGMRQRVMIAMALTCRPPPAHRRRADDRARRHRAGADPRAAAASCGARSGLAVIFVTHDLGVVADICDRVLVMYAGQIVESADVEHLFARPTHPYTEGLLRAMPRVDGGAAHLDRRTGPAGRPVPGRLPLPPPLRLRARRVPDGRPWRCGPTPARGPGACGPRSSSSGAGCRRRRGRRSRGGGLRGPR